VVVPWKSCEGTPAKKVSSGIGVTQPRSRLEDPPLHFQAHLTLLLNPGSILRLGFLTNGSTKISPSIQVVAAWSLTQSKPSIAGMADRKSAYAQPASDTDFRRTWDREEYAAKAKKEQEERKDEAKARYEAKLEGKKWHKQVDMSSLDATSARGSRLDVASMVGKSTLVPAGSAVGKRGRGAGFYCEACDLTYKDNVQYIEHLNSKQHLINTGQSGEVKRATLQEVRERIEMLKARKRQVEEEERMAAELDIGARIKKAEEIDAAEREEKRRKRNEKRRKGGDGVKQEDEFEGRLGIIT
jgi:U4/U6.U5 tri-snRNP component SNU23